MMGVRIKYYYFIIYIQYHTMKYLAAYALLALSGKNNISTSCNTQPPMILKVCSVASNLPPPMMNLTELSSLWRESRFISLLLREPRELEQVDPLPLLQAKAPLPRRKPLKNNNPRRKKSPRRSKSPKSSRLTKIWEIYSADVITLFKPSYHYQTTNSNHLN